MKKVMITLVLLLIWMPAICFAKQYEIDSTEISCTVKQDTVIKWEEKRTFSFSGNYTFGYYDLPMVGYDWFRKIVVLEDDKPYKLSENKEPGTYWVEHLDTYHRVHFYYDATNEKRTFGYNYVIEGSVKVYEDFGQFYWKMQGDRWGVSVGNFVATIHLEKPIRKEDLHVWAHGPLSGDVTIVDESTILLEAKDVPANTFVEVRLLVPSSYFITEKRETGKIGQVAIEEEREWVTDANRIRTEEMNREKRANFWRIFWDVLIYSIFLFLFGFLIYLYVVYGREYKIEENFDYIREPPSDIPPAEVGYLLKNNEMHPHTIQAVILDLIRRKFIKLSTGDGTTHKRGDLVMVRDDSLATDGLTPYELALYMEIIFHEIKEITPTELQRKIKSSPTLFYTPVEKFKRELRKAGLSRKFYDKESESMSGLAIGLSGIMFLVFIVFGVFIPHSSLFLVLIPLYWFVANKAIIRRSKNGKLLFDKYMAFKRFLSDFSQLQNYAPDSVVVWEKYLVYAVMLGVSKKVIDLLKVKMEVMKDVDQSYLFNGNSIDFVSSLNRITSMSVALGSSISGISRPAPTSSRSSSSGSFHFSSYSGGGGGFSGGGGFGGGGSGGGMG